MAGAGKIKRFEKNGGTDINTNKEFVEQVNVFCDFDGTITLQDTTDAVLEAFALPSYKEWEKRWEAGEITARECMDQQSRLLRVNPDALRSFLKDFQIDPGIYDLEKQCRAFGASLVIVSDGIDFLMNEVLNARGLSHLPHYSNRLQWGQDNRPFLTFPYAESDCRGGGGVCKRRLTEAGARPNLLTAYIGDGLSDQCVVQRADFIFAKKKLREFCLERGIVHHSFERLTEVAAALFPTSTEIDRTPRRLDEIRS